MIITKMALPRRSFLRGMGATLALPFLDAMVPALSAVAPGGGTRVSRLGFFYAPNGTYLPNFHPATTGKGYAMTPVLQALEPFRDDMVVLSGMSNKGAETQSEGGGVHTRVHTAWLSGVRPKKTEGADIEAGTSIDQMAAAAISAETPLNSLQLSLDHENIVGSCENGYSCVYQHTYSWKDPTTPMPMESNPRAVFERLFGEGGSPEEQSARLERDRSVLDLAMEDMARLQRRLGVRDRLMVDEYLGSVRDVEQRIQRAERQSRVSPMPVAEPPVGVPDSFDDHAKLMFDLELLAYQADVTRVVAFQMSRELNGRPYPWIGVPEGHHAVSHHQMDPVKIAQGAKINAYHVSLFAQFVEKMKNTPDGDGSLLDHTLLLYGTGMGDSDHHTPVDLPAVVVGGGGAIKGGRHIRYPLHTPFANLGLTLLQKVGVERDHVADSTGPLTDL
ncbi:MAG: DUF1552 domain-containing protein [Acidobacteriota bacterium]|nr:DUF1552 domain-containing protein [Acidobacteriota bacterium]